MCVDSSTPVAFPGMVRTPRGGPLLGPRRSSTEPAVPSNGRTGCWDQRTDEGAELRHGLALRKRRAARRVESPAIGPEVLLRDVSRLRLRAKGSLGRTPRNRCYGALVHAPTQVVRRRDIPDRSWDHPGVVHGPNLGGSDDDRKDRAGPLGNRPPRDGAPAEGARADVRRRTEPTDDRAFGVPPRRRHPRHVLLERGPPRAHRIAESQRAHGIARSRRNSGATGGRWPYRRQSYGHPSRSRHDRTAHGSRKARPRARRNRRQYCSLHKPRTISISGSVRFVQHGRIQCSPAFGHEQIRRSHKLGRRWRIERLPQSSRGLGVFPGAASFGSGAGEWYGLRYHHPVRRCLPPGNCPKGPRDRPFARALFVGERKHHRHGEVHRAHSEGWRVHLRRTRGRSVDCRFAATEVRRHLRDLHGPSAEPVLDLWSRALFRCGHLLAVRCLPKWDVSGDPVHTDGEHRLRDLRRRVHHLHHSRSERVLELSGHRFSRRYHMPTLYEVRGRTVRNDGVHCHGGFVVLGVQWQLRHVPRSGTARLWELPREHLLAWRKLHTVHHLRGRGVPSKRVYRHRRHPLRGLLSWKRERHGLGADVPAMRCGYGSTKAWASDLRNVPGGDVLSRGSKPVHRVRAQYLRKDSRLARMLGVSDRKHVAEGSYGLHAKPHSNRASSARGRLHRRSFHAGGFGNGRRGVHGRPRAVRLDAFGVLRSRCGAAFGASQALFRFVRLKHLTCPDLGLRRPDRRSCMRQRLFERPGALSRTLWPCRGPSALESLA